MVSEVENPTKKTKSKHDRKFHAMTRSIGKTKPKNYT